MHILLITDKVSLWPHTHRVPVPGILGRPQGVPLVMLGGQHNIPISLIDLHQSQHMDFNVHAGDSLCMHVVHAVLICGKIWNLMTRSKIYNP